MPLVEATHSLLMDRLMCADVAWDDRRRGLSNAEVRANLDRHWANFQACKVVICGPSAFPRNRTPRFKTTIQGVRVRVGKLRENE